MIALSRDHFLEAPENAPVPTGHSYDFTNLKGLP
jgi:hypothetical protein